MPFGKNMAFAILIIISALNPGCVLTQSARARGPRVRYYQLSKGMAGRIVCVLTPIPPVTTQPQNEEIFPDTTLDCLSIGIEHAR